MTNLHVHGLHVSPLGNGDNVFVHVMVGEAFDYEYQIPADHPTGLFWYHPHVHGNSQQQVDSGLAGAILIAEPPDEPPDVKGDLLWRGARDPVPPTGRERLLVLQHPKPAFDPDEPFLVNGQARPTLAIGPGEEQRWRILNASADTFFNLYLEGLSWHRVAIDGNWLPPDVQDAPSAGAVLPLGPAERAELLVTGGPNQEYALRSLWNSQRMNGPVFAKGEEHSESSLATVVRDDPIAPAEPAATPAVSFGPPPPAGTIADQRAPGDVEPRVITFQFDRGYTIDGKLFVPGRVDQTVLLGATEQWRLVNELEAGDGWHPFHLHVNDFDVTATSDGGLQRAFYQDTVPLPVRRDGNDGVVEISTRFADFTGRFVYHCHFLNHEDHAMMAAVEVAQPVRIAGSAFAPAEVTVVAGPTVPGEVNGGTTVVWTNLDGHEHTVTADDLDPISGEPRFDSGPLAPGRSFAHTFDAPGAVDYHCAIHPALTGTVVVEAAKTIEIVGAAFAPPACEVAVGTTVTWTNRRADPQTVTADDQDPSTGEPRFDSGPLDQGASFSRTFDAPGDFPYHSAIHPEITGTITVKDVTRRSVSLGILDAGLDRPDIQVPVGSTVTWANRSGSRHRVVADGLFDSGELDPERPFDPGRPFSPGQRFSHRFDRAGTIHYATAPSALAGSVQVVTPVKIVDFAFAPATVEIPAGTAVTWTNQGSEPHTVTAADGAFGSEVLRPGDRFTWVFDVPGDVAYHCAIHPQMTGTVVVT